MAEPALSAPAASVRRYDPALFATALFAPEPARERLMVLYALDVELSRAVLPAHRADAGPLIAAMRLQWWRDIAEASAAGAEPPAHEIAAPVAGLAAAGRLAPGRLAEMIAAHGAETEAALPGDGFGAWAEGRFGARTALAAGLLADAAQDDRADGGGEALDAVARPLGRALGAAFALRTAAAMARQGRSLLPGLSNAARAELAEERLAPGLAARVAALAADGLADMRTARAAATALPRAVLPAFLPGWGAARVLRQAADDPGRVARGITEPGPARRAAGLLWCSVRGGL